MACDVRDPEAISRTADQCVELCGGLPSMIVNNAAGNFIAPTERLSANAWRTIVDIVLNGTALVTMEFGRKLIAAKQGRFSYQPLWQESECSHYMHVYTHTGMQCTLQLLKVSDVTIVVF